MQIYCWATVACLAVLLLALLASRGTLLHRFFFYDVTDTGMDFSIVLSICVDVCPTDSSIRCTRRLQICFLCVVFACAKDTISYVDGIVYLVSQHEGNRTGFAFTASDDDAVCRLCYRGGLRNCIDDRTPDAQLRGRKSCWHSVQCSAMGYCTAWNAAIFCCCAGR